MTKSLINIYSFCLFIIILSACDRPDDLWEIGDDFVGGTARVVLIDSLPLSVSTVFLDSVRTSGQGQMLAGNYVDKNLGKVSCKSYFRIGYDLKLDADQEYVIDSLVLILGYSDYYEGDTNQWQSFRLHQVLEDIEPDREDAFGYLYNVNSFPYDPLPLAEKRSRTYPTQDVALRIPLPLSLAEEWMDVLTNKDTEVESLQDFQDKYKGFVLTGAEEDEAAVIGFTANEAISDPDPEIDASSLPVIRMYYREISREAEEKTYDFKLSNSSLQFNQITVDRSMSKLPTEVNQEDDISSALTDRQIYLQSGVGLMPKIVLPDLDPVLALGKGVVINAELVLKPIKGTYSSRDPLPENLILYRTDRNNQIGQPLADSFTGNLVVSRLSADYLYHKDSEYRFTITEYILSILNTDEYQDNSLLISLGRQEFERSLQSVILGGPGNKEYRMKLEIFYSLNNSNE